MSAIHINIQVGISIKGSSFIKQTTTNMKSATFHSSNDIASPSCIIKTAETEIIFFNGVGERIIQAIMKELKSR